MSLLQLLSVSQSFKGTWSEPSRYRMVEQGSLPRFVPASQPVWRMPKPEAQIQAQDRTCGRDQEKSARMAAPQRGAVRLDASTKFQPGPARSKSNRSAPLMQEELSLERVKVVRNDLAEADLEIVVARPKTSRNFPAQPGAPQEPVKLMSAVWNQLLARVRQSASYLI